MADHILLVLGISEGRRFPKRPHHQLIIEANFNGEVLTTDVVKHIDKPHFNTELAWEMNKKSLHQHRLQRTPIKVQVYAVEMTSTKKESLGYFILDLRTAQQNGAKKASWVSLLSSKYQHLKPEIKIILSVEADQIRIEEENKDKGIPVKKNKNQVPKLDENNNIDVVLDNDQGYYLIGPESSDCEIFVMSVSIGGAKNLIQVIPSDARISSEDGFYFYYSLFDNDVTNETFHDLMHPAMATERASVRIYTTGQRLAAYLRKRKVLEVYLCSSENTLAQAVVSLQPLLANNLVKTPSKVEGLFPLASTKASFSDAMVGVSIVLRREDQTAVVDVSPIVAPKQNITPVKEPVTQKLPSPPLNRNPRPKSTTPPTDTKEREQPRLSKPAKEKEHHYLFSIDIRSIFNRNIPHLINCVCRYTYPFFGSSSPVITNPPVLIQKNAEVLLPQSFCKFEFASTNRILQSTLSRVPLIVEVWHKDGNAKDELLGVAQVNLSHVFQPDNKSETGALVKSVRLPIVSAQNPGEKIGTAHVVLGFEDRGEIMHKLIATHEQSITNSDVTTAPISSVDVVDAPRTTQEYQVAMALELWREQQEEYFRSQLANKEKERMMKLAEEWKIRDTEREMILKKKVDEYNVLETKLKRTLTELDEREKQVSQMETNLQRNEQLLAEEYERKTVEMREASRRLKEEYQHQLHLERLKYTDLEERFRKGEQQLKLLEEKVKGRENEIYSLKESLLNRPEVKLQSDMNLMLVEKVELERKIESITKSKIHYKQQWGRALRELARMKVNEQEAAQTRLKKQQQELEHMKLRYLAAEEREVMKNEKEELDDVKEEINQRLQQLQAAMTTAQHQTQNPREIENTENLFSKNRISKLIEERDTLLQTGVYTINDRVIEEIEKEIQNLIDKDK
ncbi:centrosomal protein of 120 kDa-like [Hydractinia symbiolongicarpus]|uniref:centrosomal protein of 120 kDa-like n=1 Tax=Hydractinia symbiolongicarpus TaxID=13093 RepID=UPI00254A8206|nr:centrosomal protein of 120 kDa-like [Hydractinia symbiolongicarpus]